VPSHIRAAAAAAAAAALTTSRVNGIWIHFFGFSRQKASEEGITRGLRMADTALALAGGLAVLGAVYVARGKKRAACVGGGEATKAAEESAIRLGAFEEPLSAGSQREASNPPCPWSPARGPSDGFQSITRANRVMSWDIRNGPIIIGVAGASGSGKTTMCTEIKARLRNEVRAKGNPCGDV
jgi:hypothetical protein